MTKSDRKPSDIGGVRMKTNNGRGVLIMFTLAMAIMAVPTAAVSAAEEDTGDVRTADGELPVSVTASAPEYDELAVAGTIILKLSSAGDPVWWKDLRWYGSTRFSSAAAVSDGFAAVGNSVAMFDGSGYRIWQKDFDQSDRILLSSAAAASGGFVAVGKRGYDATIVRYNDLGETVWENDLGVYDSVESFSSVTAVPDGFVAVGRSYDNITYIADGWSNRGEGCAVIAKFSDTGGLVWDIRLGSNYSYLESVAAVPDGMIAAGYLDRESVIVKFGGGTMVWKKRFDAFPAGLFGSVAAVPGGFVAVGSTLGGPFGGTDARMLNSMTKEKKYGGRTSEVRHPTSSNSRRLYRAVSSPQDTHHPNRSAAAVLPVSGQKAI